MSSGVMFVLFGCLNTRCATVLWTICSGFQEARDLPRSVPANVVVI